MNRVQPASLDCSSIKTNKTKEINPQVLEQSERDVNKILYPTLPFSSSSSSQCTQSLKSCDESDNSSCACYCCTSHKVRYSAYDPCGMSTKTILSSDLSNNSNSSAASTTSASDFTDKKLNEATKSRIFPSTRFFIAILLCFCFMSLSISTSNMSVSMVCMIRKPPNVVTAVDKDFVQKEAIKTNRTASVEFLNEKENFAKNFTIKKSNLMYYLLKNFFPENRTNSEASLTLRLKRNTNNNSNWELIKNISSAKQNVTNTSYSATNIIPNNTSSKFISLKKYESNNSLIVTDNNTSTLNDDARLITELLEMLDGIDSAIIQHQPQQEFLTMSTTKCQLSRFRKHINNDTNKQNIIDIMDTTSKSSNNLVSYNLPYNNLIYNKLQQIGEKADKRSGQLTVVIESCYEAEKLQWSSTDQGIVFAAQNAGSLLMLVSGTQADRLNSKWTIVFALTLLVISNAILPIVANASVWLVVAARVLTGFSDALLQPSTSSMITRWFPPKERPFAIGLITGGRQIGTLLILPVAGFLCSRRDILNGWPAIFYLSALIGSVILFMWLFMAADKPSKHFCTSHIERFFVEQKISEENLGKRSARKTVPWRQIITCKPIYIAIAALICHEYPLVIMLQLLPKYINDVLKFSITTNGLVSALPIAVLFLSKTFSCSVSSYIGARKKGRFIVSRTNLVKIFNGIASLGLGICVAIVPLLTSEDQKVMAVIVLCLANFFAGLHTPGVQTALLQLAPAYTGIITGIAFGFVAIFGIINKVLSNYIVQSGTVHEWMIVFWIAAFIAILPVGFFTLWGSADRQLWATSPETRASADKTIDVEWINDHDLSKVKIISNNSKEKN